MASEEKKASTSKSEKSKRLAQEQILYGFNQLRQEQRNLAAKIAELEMDLNEHNLVAEALKDVDGDRRCFRMIGGVLVERTVKEVLPAVLKNKEQISKLIESLQQNLASKGQEINEYREKYNIQLREPGGPPQPPAEQPQQPETAPSVLVETQS